MKREYFALSSLFQRSGLSAENQDKILQSFVRWNSSQPSRPPPSSSKDSDDSKQNKSDDNKNDEDEKMPTLLAKAFLWLLTAYFTVALLSILFPSSSQQEVRVEHFYFKKFIFICSFYILV